MKQLLTILFALFALQGAIHAAKEGVVSLSLKKNERSLVAVFSNQTKSDITILKPLDGSMWCWHMPYYDFSVFNSAGNSVKIGGRCGLSGLWANTEWPKDYLVVIKSGEAFELPLTLPHHLEDGRYQVTLAYVYSNDGTRKMLNHKYPEKIWRGKLKSNLVSIVVGKHNQAEDGADQPATAPESKSEGREKPKPESEGRPE